MAGPAQAARLLGAAVRRDARRMGIAPARVIAARRRQGEA